MHDSNLWNHFVLGQFCEASRSSPYVLVGDVAYPIRPWMFPSYKGHKYKFYPKFNTNVCGTCIRTFERLLEDFDEANEFGIDIGS